MKFHDNEDEIEFETTGRRLYANAGIIGLSEDLVPHEGYDGDLEESEDYLKPKEMIELAEYMIGLWTRYKATATTAGSS